MTKSTGIPVCIGVAPTKSLAKLANKIAKKFQEKTGGVYVIDTDEKRVKALKWLAIGDVWGIGRQLSKKLMQHGIKNAYQFTQLPDEWIRKNLSIVELRLKMDLEGKPTIALEDVKSKKSIATTRTFDTNYLELSKIQERVSTFAVTCSEKLRKQQSSCNSIMVFIQTNGFRADMPQYNKSIVVKTDYPTNSSIDIVKLAVIGLNAIYKEGFSYKKAGVIVMDIVPENQNQLNLFVAANPKHNILMSVMDKLNKMIGQKKIKLACQDLGRTWKMNQEKLSPSYSTRIDDIITLKV